MLLLQFVDPAVGKEIRLGRVAGDEVIDLTSGDSGIRTLYDLVYAGGGADRGLAVAAEAIGDTGRRLQKEALLSNVDDPTRPHLVSPANAPSAAPHLLRVWLAGVTHEDSARLREIEAKQATGGAVNVYDQKYRECQAGGIPELFAKTDSAGPVGHGAAIAFPPDTLRMVPEAELVTIYALDSDGQVVLLGYTGGNDYTDNGMEAKNPLNLPQAKNWHGGCASLGPILVTAEAFDAADVRITCEVIREGRRVGYKEGRTGEANLNMPDGALHLERALFSRLPLLPGELQVLYWGTPAVFGETDLKDGLREGDRVRMTFEGIGTLENRIAAFPPMDQLRRIQRK